MSKRGLVKCCICETVTSGSYERLWVIIETAPVPASHLRSKKGPAREKKIHKVWLLVAESAVINMNLGENDGRCKRRPMLRDEARKQESKLPNNEHTVK